MKDIIKRSIEEHAAAFRRREYSSKELTEACLSVIREREGEVSAFLHIDEKSALEAAERADCRIAEGETSPLCGIPMSLKDNICTEGIPTTCASKMLSGYVPPYSATVWERLRGEGCVLIGKTNMDEFAMGSDTATSAFCKTRNPLDPKRSPGGSSGGSGASVASGEAVFSLGSDTGGSVRCPAAYCGLVAMKPTYGRVSRYGLVAFASSLDQIGPITNSVSDNALVLGAISGKDARDQTTAKDIFKADELKKPCTGLRVGFCEGMAEGASEDVRKALLRALDAFRAMGAEIVDVDIPSNKYATEAYYIISSAEASSNLARFDSVRYGHRAATDAQSISALYAESRGEGFGREVKRRILLGTFVLSEGSYEDYYRRACIYRQRLKRELSLAFEKCDIILTPAAPDVAPIADREESVVETYIRDKFSVCANMGGIPAIVLPFGHGEGGMPIGIQLMGNSFSEGLLYRCAEAVEKAGGDLFE